MALSGKELDDSIFGTNSHLDWADEVNMEPLNDETFAPNAGKHDEGVGSMVTSPQLHNNGNKAKTARESRGRAQQERQPRQGGRGNRGGADGAYGGSQRGDRDNARSGSRGGPRSRAGRSGSRQGNNSQQSGHMQPMPGGGSGRQGRGPRDRSTSMERPRNWRGSTSRARADKIDRWDHDKFDAAPAQPARSNRGRRSSSGTYGAPSTASVDIEQIGKEGISHVTINRRGSNASSRGHLAASFDQSRQLSGSIDSHGDAGESMGHERRKSRSGPYANHSGQLLSPRSPPLAAAAGTEPYRAPHRRQSSADSHPPQLPPVAATSVVTNPAPDADPEQPHVLPAEPQVKPAITKNEDEGSSAEAEWENFVANGGLDIPFESITDELLKQPRRPLTQSKGSQQKNDAHQRLLSEKTRDRTELLLNDDNDDTDDFSESTGTSDAHADRSQRQNKQSDQGISIRGSAKKAAAAVMVTAKSSTARVSEGKASQGSDYTASRTVSAGKTPSRQQQPAKKANPPSNQGKVLKPAPTATNGHKPVDKTPALPAQPTQPPHPAQSSRSRSTTPTKPATPTRPLSRASSSEGSSRPIGGVPSSYMRRQYETYDEDRGRHVFSVNIPYDEHRFAPIHVHERDDISKLVAKFARIWRVHNKEQRIKRMLSKMKAVMQDDPL
ncbi:hypothetical protein GGH12_000375 [Coemansia sp. RSA 1822]|nr:hypothetical protein LPJ76_004384 [Coemansia sp. RSA 638]KAJ2540733.1 hypothetical protein GGF49_004215 [Coemansia sp. RSA 1853]KAJ2567262.1 hypothetical protein GGH12_000375 [Coemansia sp. RSA 1822]